MRSASRSNSGKLSAKKWASSRRTWRLAWVLQNPVVTAPIIGPRTLEQLTGSMRALKIRFKKDELKRIDEIWPGPGGAAPEAYAWWVEFSC